jgi:hypothetical protein
MSYHECDCYVFVILIIDLKTTYELLNNHSLGSDVLLCNCNV